MTTKLQVHNCQPASKSRNSMTHTHTHTMKLYLLSLTAYLMCVIVDDLSGKVPHTVREPCPLTITYCPVTDLNPIGQLVTRATNNQAHIVSELMLKVSLFNLRISMQNSTYPKVSFISALLAFKINI